MHVSNFCGELGNFLVQFSEIFECILLWKNPAINCGAKYIDCYGQKSQIKVERFFAQAA